MALLAQPRSLVWRGLSGLVTVIALAGCGAGSGTGTAAASASSSSTSTTIPSSTTAASTTNSTTAGSAACVGLQPLEAVAGQIVLAIAGQGSIAGMVDDLVAGRLGGVVVVGNVDADIGAVLAPLSGAAIAPIVAVDEEGGDVQRLASVLGDQPSARDLAGLGSAATREAGRARAVGAGDLGFTVILAPVLDVHASPGSPTRTYGDDSATVMEYGLAYADGIAEGGLVAVAKHFPGHGTADGDSHDELPTTSNLDVLRQTDLVPFQTAAAWVPAIMLGHLVVPGLTDGLPATISKPAVDLLRGQLEFDGVVVTDDLSMGAMSQWGPVASGELALIAGADLLMAGNPDDARALVSLIIEEVAAGRVDRTRMDEAAARVLQMKGLDPCQISFGE